MPYEEVQHDVAKRNNQVTVRTPSRQKFRLLKEAVGVLYTFSLFKPVFRGDLIICHLALLTNGEKCVIIIIGSDTQCGVLKYYYDK